MGFVNTFLFIYVLINLYNNITFTCSRKVDNHEESRSFIGFGTHTASERPCACNTTAFCSCCQIVKILYTLKPKKLCFNMIYQANILNFELSLDTLIMKSMTVASYRPFQMCADIPGVLLSKVCVSILNINRFPGPAVTVCPRMELSTKKESWIIPYTCSTLMINGTVPMGMVVVMQPAKPAPGMPTMPPAGVGAPGPMGAAAGMAAMSAALARPPAGSMSAMASAPAASAMGPPAAMGSMPSAALMAAKPPAPAVGAMSPAAAMGAMPAAPGTGPMSPAPAMGAKPTAPGMGTMPPASTMPAASMIVPRFTGTAGSPVFLVMMNQNLASALKSAMAEASASMSQENHQFAPESRFDSGITILENQTDQANEDEQPLLTDSNGDRTTDLNSDPESYEQGLKVESTTETEGKFKTLKRKKRNYDIFDVFHQSNRCERAYRICVTRSKHYIVSRLRNTKQNAQVKNDKCGEELVRIVHEPDGNLCAQLNWNDNITPSQVTHPPSEFHDPITSTDDSLSAIVIQDEYSEGSDFHPQNNQHPIPLLTYTNAEMYPSRIPPIALKELNKNLNVSILQENLENLNSDKPIILAVKK